MGNRYLSHLPRRSYQLRSFIHDTIKILYTNLGYLPNYPYHLISDDEMFDAFMKEDGGVFTDYYPCGKPVPENISSREWDDLSEYDPWDGDLITAYEYLKECIFSKITLYRRDQTKTIPNWVYSYMLLTPISYDSTEIDIQYLYDLIGLNSDAEMPKFNHEVAKYCFAISNDWIHKTPGLADRVPSMFGEAHVIKSLRLQEAIGEYPDPPKPARHRTHGELHDEGFTHDILANYKQDEI